MDNVTAVSAGILNTQKGECVGLIGPLERAWQQCFPNGLPYLTIIWHEGWLHRSDGKNHWRELYDKLKACNEGTEILVVIFAESPGRPSKEKPGNPLGVLLRTIAEGATPEPGTAEWRVGWAPVSEIGQFESRAVKWQPAGENRDSSLPRLCLVCEELLEPKNETPKGKKGNDLPPLPTLHEFFEFLDDPMIYRARKLHAAGDNAEEAKRGLRFLKWLESYVFVPGTLPINVLLVENDPKKLGEAMDKTRDVLGRFIFGGLGPRQFFSAAKVYLLRTKDKALNALTNNRFEAEEWSLDQNVGPDPLPKKQIRWDELDLILQDIVLDNRDAKLHGLELVSHYFEACPQALVFLLTSLDVESLVGSGDVNWRYVDAILSKDATETLAYEYRRCFRERFGRMFWVDWPSALTEQPKVFRGLFGSLRRWQIEPDILWHGQSLPEMIDHANRHISALWRLTNDFVGTLLENDGANKNVLSLRHRVALAVAVWMHDVGHRGDEYIAGSMDIRASHAGISERLLLRNPDAYGLKWLLQDTLMPHAPCRQTDAAGRDSRLECRNQTVCKEGNGPLCLLREAGLLCRHHQSNAPLGKDSLNHMAGRGKAPSVYSLVPDPENLEISSEEFLRDMINDSRPMPSPSGTKVRVLEDFGTSDPQHFRSVAGVLRILDALQLHRARVGTGAFLASFEEFLETRFKWCAAERIRLEKALRVATPGTLASQRAMGDLDALDEYELLLTTQKIHFWRQSVVHETEVRWTWMAAGRAGIDICFVLNERALARLETESMQAKLPDGNTVDLHKELVEISGISHLEIDVHEHKAAIKKWLYNLEDEVVGDECESQYPSGIDSGSNGYREVLASKVEFRVGVTRTDKEYFSTPLFVRIPRPQK